MLHDIITIASDLTEKVPVCVAFQISQFLRGEYHALRNVIDPDGVQVRVERKEGSIIPHEFPIACRVLARLSHKAWQNFEAYPQSIMAGIVVIEEGHCGEVFRSVHDCPHGTVIKTPSTITP